MKRLLFSISVCFAVLFTSCAKQEGCKDSTAANYDPEAEEDDGSCTYEASLVFWWSQELSQDAAALDVTAINVTVDGVFQGSLAVSASYFTSIPTCGASGTITAKSNLGKSKSKSVLVKYELLSGTTLLDTVNETITVSAGCNTYEVY